MQVAWIPLVPERRMSNAARRSELARACRSNTLKLQQTIEAHAKANRTCLKPVFEGVVLGLEVIPLFRLRSVPPGHNNADNKNAKAQSSERNPYMIDEGCAQSNNIALYLIVALGRVGPCFIRAMQWVERHDVDRTWTVHGEVQVMRHHKIDRLRAAGASMPLAPDYSRSIDVAGMARERRNGTCSCSSGNTNSSSGVGTAGESESPWPGLQCAVFRNQTLPS